MIDRSGELSERYAKGLAEYIKLPDEAGLVSAYQLGRELMAQGYGVIHFAALHTRAVVRATPPVDAPAELSRRSWQFFAEALAPFEMALRGYRESNEALKALASTLEQRVQERTRELSQAERALREQSRIMTAVAGSISDGIAVADSAGKFLFVNQPARKIIGEEATDGHAPIPGAFLPDGTTPFSADELPLLRAMRGEQTQAIPMLVRNKDFPDGAQLSVIGSPWQDEVGGIEGGVVVFRDVTASQRAEDARRRSDERYRMLFERSPLPMWTYDRGTLAFVSVNDSAVRHYGYSREQFAGMTIADIRPPDDVTELLADVAQASPELQGKRWRHLKKDGSIILVEIRAHDFERDGRPERLVLVNDVTAAVRAHETLAKTEDQLRQSQKMDAIGRLAGGVAHDFNNILTVIISVAELVLEDLKPGEPLAEDIEEIRKAGRRAADLTKQLLMFSRHQVFEPKVLELNTVLGNMEKMLQRLIGADVDLVSFPNPSLGKIRADPGSLEQVIMNLAINARDAMPTGGQLTLETSNVLLDEEFASQHVGATPGPHVMLAVSDTGVGMDRATQARIFEPFFTTKEKGKGTGLGLSTVFGIVRQSGGSIWVYSEPGKGTTFKIYFPRTDSEVDVAPAVRLPETLFGSETILLVEDDDQVRDVAQGILKRYGYRVIEARNAGEALLHSEGHAGAIDLLLTDVVMPQLSGPELAQRLGRARPTMKILCMSGYTDESIVRHGVLEARIAYLQKPLTPEGLARKVRELLDAPLEL